MAPVTFKPQDETERRIIEILKSTANMQRAQSPGTPVTTTVTLTSTTATATSTTVTAVTTTQVYIQLDLYSPTIIPLPDDKFLDWSKLKQIADDILKSI